MSVDIPGLVSVIVFYIIILIIGLWAARKTGFKTKNLKIDDVMLANRSIGVFVGTFTMTATWVGGGYINGTTEAVAVSGLAWTQGPIGYAISLIFGGFFFAKMMRNSGFTTLLDPFHWKYGDIMNCLLYLPALCGDVFWSGAILAALGATLKVILDLELTTSILISAGIACLYTLLGGLYSVAYTDVVQLICMFIGLYLCVPFAVTHDAVQPITTNGSDYWLGEITPDSIGNYVDFGMVLILGGIPWQVYWQRALSAKSAGVAQLLSYLGAIGCVIMAIPSVILGAVAASADWNLTGYGRPNISADDQTLILPLVMYHLCPRAVSIIGLGAISAAVMSSTDSSVLASSSMFSRNVVGVIYARIFKKKISETAQVWIMRGAQIVITAMACAMAIKVNSIYGLWFLCSDFVFVLLFPQLVCVMYLKGTNSYGSFLAYSLGLFFRLAGGDPTLEIPAIIKYPWYLEESNTQMFPYRTLSMLISLFTLIFVSYTVEFAFRKQWLDLKWDFYGCFQHLAKDNIRNGVRGDNRNMYPPASNGATRQRTVTNGRDNPGFSNLDTQMTHL